MADLTLIEKIQTAAKIKAETPEITDKALLMRVGYAETTAQFNKPDWFRSEQFKYWVQVYSAFEHIKNIAKMGDAAALNPIMRHVTTEILARVEDPNQVKKMSIKELKDLLSVIGGLVVKTRQDMGQEARQAVMSLDEAKSEILKRLPAGYNLDIEQLN